jgi:opacity protein-like surface antigen
LKFKNIQERKKSMKKIFAAAALLAAMAVAAPVIAAEAPGYGVVVGGRIHYDIGWQIKSGDKQVGNATEDTLVNFFSSIRPSSYLNATFSSPDKTTGAKVEIGLTGNINQDNAGGADASGTTLRLAYGWWKAGSCTLLAGQAWTRLGAGVQLPQLLGGGKSNKGELIGFGFISPSRTPRLAFSMEVNDNFGFDISIAQAGSEFSANKYAAPAAPATTASGVYDGAGSTDNYLPRLELVLDFKFGGFKISPGAGISYEKWKFTDADSTAAANDNLDLDDSVLSYLLFLPVKYQNGPFWAVLSAFYGQNHDSNWNGENGVNPTTYDINTFRIGTAGRNYGGQPFALPVAGDNGKIEDTTAWGVGLGLGYALTEQFTIQIAGGFDSLSNDGWGLDDGNDSYTRWAIWLAAPYKLTSNLTIQPEVMYFDYGDAVGYGHTFDDEDAGSEWLVGVNFQFLF